MSNSTDPCKFSDFTRYIMDNNAWFVQMVVMPIYLIFGTIGRSLSLLTFYYKAKEESAYLYQIFVTVAELVNVLVQTITVTEQKLAEISPWFYQCWFCMALRRYTAAFAGVSSVFCAILISFFMTVDRIYALARPVQYHKNLNRKKQQWAIFAFCIFFSCFTSIPIALYYYRSEWLATITLLSAIQISVRFVITFMMIIASIILTVVYRIRMKERLRIMNKNDKKAHEEIDGIRTLFWLTLVQAVFTNLSTVGDFAYNLFDFLCIYLDWDNCWQCYLEPILLIVTTRFFLDMIDFYVVFCFLPSFRKSVIDSIKRLFKCGNTVSTANVVAIAPA